MSILKNIQQVRVAAQIWGLNTLGCFFAISQRGIEIAIKSCNWTVHQVLSLKWQAHKLSFKPIIIN